MGWIWNHYFWLFFKRKKKKKLINISRVIHYGSPPRSTTEQSSSVKPYEGTLVDLLRFCVTHVGIYLPYPSHFANLLSETCMGWSHPHLEAKLHWAQGGQLLPRPNGSCSCPHKYIHTFFLYTYCILKVFKLQYQGK